MLGTGNIGMRHLHILKELAGESPIAVSRRPERNKELAEEGYDTSETLEAAAYEGANRCIIATETSSHVANAKEALDCGFDVLVEKPLGTSFSEAQDLPQTFARAEHQLSVGCVLRFSPSLNKFRESLELAGRLHHVGIEHRSYLPQWRPHRPYLETYSARAKEGGVLLDSIHEVDLAGWIFGWPASVQGQVRNLGRLGIDADELAQIMWEAPGGFPVSINLDYLTRPPRRKVTASGEQGTVEWDGIENTVKVSVAGETVSEHRFPQPMVEVFLQQTNAFLNACRGDADPRLADGKDGLRALAVCDAVRRASESKRYEPVEAL